MRQVWLDAERRCGAIVLVFFGHIGFDIGKLRNFELVGVSEEHRWPDDGVGILYKGLVHCFQFSVVSREVWRDGQYGGQVFWSTRHIQSRRCSL